MKNIAFVFVAAVSFAGVGCKKGGGADCAKAIDHSMELSKADMAKMPGMDDKMLEKMKNLGIQHCKDDKWADDAIKCMTDAKTEADAQACYGKLSHEQQDKMNQAAMELAKPPGGAGSAAPAPTGSDTGSAGAGSAPAPSDTGSGAAGSAAVGSAAAPK